MFAIYFEFPAGRYCAANHADTSTPEWPPNPARAYAALVATAYESERARRSNSEIQLNDRFRNALIWLEAAGAPTIWCPDADQEAAPTSYVPINDQDTRLKRDSKGRSPHPIYALNQPREFPQAYLLGEPQVVYGWEKVPDEQVLSALDELASQVTHLGTTHSFVLARAVAVLPSAPARYKPASDGTAFLRVVRPGRLGEMDRQFHASGSGALRYAPPSHEALVAYRDLGSHSVIPKLSARHELLILRFRSLAWYAEDSEVLARAFRSAVMSILGDAVPAAVHGHDDTAEHVAWLPLPDVGHVNARNRIIGIGVGVPLSMSDADRVTLLTALNKLTELRLPGGRVAEVVPLNASDAAVQSLNLESWTRHSLTHCSVTPVVLDRPPKRKTHDALAASVRTSLMIAGYPEPAMIEVRPDSAWVGAAPAHATRTSVPRFHVSLTFKHPIAGPILLGRLRNFGVGLLRPVIAR